MTEGPGLLPSWGFPSPWASSESSSCTIFIQLIRGEEPAKGHRDCRSAGGHVCWPEPVNVTFLNSERGWEMWLLCVQEDEVGLLDIQPVSPKVACVLYASVYKTALWHVHILNRLWMHFGAVMLLFLWMWDFGVSYVLSHFSQTPQGVLRNEFLKLLFGNLRLKGMTWNCNTIVNKSITMIYRFCKPWWRGRADFCISGTKFWPLHSLENELASTSLLLSAGSGGRFCSLIFRDTESDR